MNDKPFLKKLLAFALAAVLALSLFSGLGSNTANAARSDELKSQLSELEKDKAAIDAKIAELQGQIDENMGEMEKLVAEKNVIDQEIALLNQQKTNINDQVATYSLMIADRQEELVAAEAKLKALNEKYKERIRTMEEQGPLSYWSVLFKANSFSDLLDRIAMVEEIAAADQRRLQEIRDAAKIVSDAKAELTQEKEALEEKKAELTATEETLNTKRAEADVVLTELKAKDDKFAALMAESEDKQDKLMADIAAKEKEYDTAKEQEWLATSVPSQSSGGGGASNTVGGITWLVPINYTAVTSPFGNRWHPISGKWKMHNGVDLAAPQGRPIYATRSGKVTTASYEEGGAGWYVSINHLDGYASIYMHMTHYIVKAGQYVEAGQVIGYCGSSGGSTGPHLHFGISYNGTYVNPANYISI